MVDPITTQPLRDRTLQRSLRLLGGLVLYGVALAALVRARLGLDPWTVFADGLSKVTGWTLGTVTVVVSLGLLLLWIPLRQRPGVGTLANAVVVGLVLDGALRVIPMVSALPIRVVLMCVAILGVAVATGLYVGAGWGPGARDGLMTGLAAKGIPILIGRTVVEVTVLVIGWLLGGSVGVGTVLFALSMGALVSRTLPAMTVRRQSPGPDD